MRCKSCNEIMHDYEILIDAELCLECLEIVQDSLDELDDEDHE